MMKGTDVNKLAVTLLGTALFAGAASAATTAETEPVKKSGTTYWLHPKQGYVKVDRATNAIVVGKRRSTDATTTEPTPTNVPTR